MRRGCCCGGNECYTNAYISLVVSQRSETSFECDSFTPTEVWYETQEDNIEDNITDVGGGPRSSGGFGVGSYRDAYHPVEVGSPTFLYSHRWHKDETEEFGNLFCMLNEDVFHPKVNAAKYGITPEMRADDVEGGQIDEKGKVRIGLELALHYKWYDPNEVNPWYGTPPFVEYYEDEFFDPNSRVSKVEYPACVENPSQYIVSGEFVHRNYDDDGWRNAGPEQRFVEDCSTITPEIGSPCFCDPNNGFNEFEQGLDNQGHVYCSDWFLRQENNVPPSCSASRCVTSEQLCNWIKSPEAKLVPPYGPTREDHRSTFNCVCSQYDAWTPNAVSPRCCGFIYRGDEPPLGQEYYFGTDYFFPDSIGGHGGIPQLKFHRQWYGLIPYTCPPTPPTCLGAERPGLPGLEYLFKEVSPRAGDTKGELNGTSEIVDYTYNKIIQRFGPTILPDGSVNPFPNNIVIHGVGGHSWSIDEIGPAISAHGSAASGFGGEYSMFIDFAEALFKKYVDEHGVDVAIQRFSPCGVNHPEEYGGDGCVGFHCLEPSLENYGVTNMGYKPVEIYYGEDGSSNVNSAYQRSREYDPCMYFNTKYPSDETNPHPLGFPDPLGLRFHTDINAFYFNNYVGRFDYVTDPDGYPVDTRRGFLSSNFVDGAVKTTGLNGVGLGTLFYTSAGRHSGFASLGNIYDDYGYVHKLWTSLEHWLCPNCSFNDKNEFIDEDKFYKYFPDGDVNNLLFTVSYSYHPDTSLFDYTLGTGEGRLGNKGQIPKSDLDPDATGFFYPGRVMGESDCYYYNDVDGAWWTNHFFDYLDAWCAVEENADNIFCTDYNRPEQFWIPPDEAAAGHNPCEYTDDCDEDRPRQRDLGGHSFTYDW